VNARGGEEGRGRSRARVSTIFLLARAESVFRLRSSLNERINGINQAIIDSDEDEEWEEEEEKLPRNPINGARTRIALR
jgi:hypothetical protein